MGTKKYEKIQKEAEKAVLRNSLPHKIKSPTDSGFISALYQWLRRRGHKNIGIATDPDKDGIWLRKYKK